MNKPYLDSDVISANPSNAKQQITITLEVNDRAIVFSTPVYYAGEIKSGEQIGVM